MLTPFDDYPIHQTPAPIAMTATPSPDQYDRYFFNGHHRDGDFFLGAAMGHYPNRGVIDAAFCIVHDGVEHSVFASGMMPVDRATEIGPIRIEVLEPLRTIRVVVEDHDTGLTADVTFRARTAAVQEPRQTIVRGHRMIMDYTRLTQWGTWEGTVAYDRDGASATLAVNPAEVTGTRDRSWGIRGVGDPAPTNFPAAMPQIFWLWAPLHFDDVCTHLALFEHADGERWLQSGLVVPVLDRPDAPTWGEERPGEEMASVDYDLEWEPGTREMRRAAVTLRGRDGAQHRIELEKHYTFRMRGIGYTHPRFRHGSNHGELEVAGESIALDAFDPTDPSSIHVQTLVTARWGDRTGIGILEQLAFGDHAPTGLTGMVDGFAG